MLLTSTVSFVKLIIIKALKGSRVTLYLNVESVVYLEVLVIVEHLDNILFCHYSKIIFKYDSLAIFAGTTQKGSCPPPPHITTHFEN